MMPKVSVVTVNLNNCTGLEKTIQSVVSQTYKCIEYIVVDGASIDGSVDVIRYYNSHISKWISENDKGVYDAMNKGVDLVSGDWVIFMNSGDAFYNDRIVESLFIKRFDERYSVVYGNVCLCFRRGNIIKDLTPIKAQMPPFCHQSMFVRTEAFKKKGFDLKYTICADYDFAFSLYKSGAEFFHVNLTIANYDMTGISAQRLDLYYKEFSTIEGNYSSLMMLKNIVKSRIRSVFPGLFDALFFWILKFRNKKKEVC